MSDNMDDIKATIELVYSKLKNAHIYDPHVSGALPEGVSAQSDLAAQIKTGATYGDGVMLNGQSIKKIDGSDAVVGTTTVIANLSDSIDSAIRNRIGLLVTPINSLTHLDAVVAGDLQYHGASSLAK